MKSWMKKIIKGNAVVNYTEREIPYTRIIEHKHFEYGTQPKTVITVNTQLIGNVVMNLLPNQ